MDYEVIYSKCKSSVKELSKEVLDVILKGKKAVIALSCETDSNESFLKDYMHLNISELEDSDLNLLNFSRNIACAFKIAELLPEIKSSVISLLLDNKEIDGISSGDYRFEADFFSNKFDFFDLLIVCIFEKHNFDGYFLKIEEDNPISGALIADDVSEFKIFLGENPSDLCLTVFSSLAENKISLDMINICYDELYFICNTNDAGFVSSILLDLGCNYERQNSLFKLSFTGLGMKGVPGIMHSIYSAFEKKSILILRTTDSHTTISCLLEQSNREGSIELLKSVFKLSNEKIIN